MGAPELSACKDYRVHSGFGGRARTVPEPQLSPHGSDLQTASADRHSTPCIPGHGSAERKRNDHSPCWVGLNLPRPCTTVWILVVEYQLVTRTAFQNLRV